MCFEKMFLDRVRVDTGGGSSFGRAETSVLDSCDAFGIAGPVKGWTSLLVASEERLSRS